MRSWVIGTAGLLLSCGTAAAGVSEITFRTVFDNPGPYGNGEVVTGSVWLDWAAPGQGEPWAAVDFGQFALLMNGRGSFILPEERPSDQVYEPTHPGGTLWLEGRRPPWLAGGQDGFRRPPVEPIFGLRYRINVFNEELSSLSGTIASSPSGIVYQQPPLDSIGDLLVNDASFEVFRFRVAMPETGSGSITITPWGGGGGHYYTSPAGHADEFEDVFYVNATITYVPSPPVDVGVILGMAVVFRRRRLPQCNSAGKHRH